MTNTGTSPTTKDPRQTRGGSILQRLSVVMAAAGLVLATIALGSMIVDDDPPAPKILSAKEAAAAGNPTIELGDMFIRGDLSVTAAETLAVINRGTVPHNLTLEGGPRTPDLNHDQAVELDLATVAPGTYTVFCAIEGHRAAGMEAQLIVGATG